MTFISKSCSNPITSHAVCPTAIVIPHDASSFLPKNMNNKQSL